MAPSNLQGLNIVHNAPRPNPYLTDADLLSVPPYPELNAQLDLWTNLNFQSDEPLVHSRAGDNTKNRPYVNKPRLQDDASEDDPERYNDADESGIAETHSHENVVTGTVLPPTGVVHTAHPSSENSPGQMPSFDLQSLLAGFGIDPFMAPAPVPQASNNTTNTIAQLLSMHAASAVHRPSINTSQTSTPSTRTSPAQSPVSPTQAPNPPAAAATTKRVRTARGSLSVTSPTETTEQLDSPEDPPSGTPLTAAEDKRRRNTAASARFRLKKKEREAALERKAKELELRVSELEKECEALRRENGWLKGLVVGVTGAGAVQQQLQSGPVSSDSTGLKRAREDDA